MSAEITCGAVQESLALYLYGELSFDEEERVERHLEACGECRAALGRDKALHAALDQVEIHPPSSLLHECRENLQARLEEEQAVGRAPSPARDAHVPPKWWQGWLRPVAALALLAIGFFTARMIPQASSEPEAARVRNVEPAAGGRVQIVLDETRQRVVSGQPDDRQIRALLMSAAKDPSDPGLRAETVDILSAEARSADVRDALVYSLRHDQNAGVRLKALEGLKPFAREAAVRSALEQVLLSDSNPGLRTQAIDLLTVGPGENLDREMVGTLQELMSREDNSYVRERSQRALQLVKASAQTY